MNQKGNLASMVSAILLEIIGMYTTAVIILELPSNTLPGGELLKAIFVISDIIGFGALIVKTVQTEI